MLSPLDDYPIHQAAEPMRFVATTDRNFYDRYYFNAMPLDASFVLTCGLGTYPNRDVCDAFVALTHRGVQRVVRASRRLGADRMDLSCGPFRLEVIEAMHRLRFTLEPGRRMVGFDLTWTGSMPAQLEPDQNIRHGAQLTTDTKRFVQTCRVEGEVLAAGSPMTVDRSSCWGNRDRSWGVRIVGEPEAVGARAAMPSLGFFWIYAIAQFESYSVVVMIQEDRDGNRSIGHGRRYWHDGAPAEDLGLPIQRDIELHRGTRRLQRASFELRSHHGSTHTLDVETGPASFLGLGTGYGVDPDWRHGMWQGADPVVQERSYDLEDAAVLGSKLGIHDNLGVFDFDGQRGVGLLEFAVMGPYAPLGL